MNRGVGKGRASYMVHAELRVPLAIKIIDFEAPILFGFESIHDIFEISAVGAVRSKIFDKFI